MYKLCVGIWTYRVGGSEQDEKILSIERKKSKTKKTEKEKACKEKMSYVSYKWEKLTEREN
jgi:hypothetical protein